MTPLLMALVLVLGALTLASMLWFPFDCTIGFAILTLAATVVHQTSTAADFEYRRPM